MSEKPSNARGDAPAAYDSVAYEASAIIKSAPGNLYGFAGYNSKLTPQFIQVHDSATLPADGAIPKVILTVPAVSNFSWNSGEFPKAFANGIVICNSSTGPTKTIGAADCWFSVLSQ
jgi:hypothetical protein